ncbi:hypothetical protein HCN44_000602 [Aphidius gifuensis]|uniref:Ribokinase n=1 Tax=Aphidius gifuensis TaxID=684658 RepID=A0A835CP04_APHGI|nr:ribokinase-like [Aphidius gifuensis]KAF7990797.1 hypothetical protein HCN44_000602 [Aphidius gifuensis]
MSSIVVVGSCMIDSTSFSERLPKPGETIAGTRFDKTFGGKGANQCVAAAKLGATTSLIAALGNDASGREYINQLEKYKINSEHVKLVPDVSSGSAQIMVAENGENMIVIVKGANDYLTSDDVNKARQTIKNASVLITQFESSLDATLEALKLHKGHGTSILNGAPALANPGREILESCDIFCVNETEAQIMTGIEPLNLINAQDALDKLFIQGCKIVIITLGGTGSVFATRKQQKMIHIPVEIVKPIDTTGAGDAFLGALAYFLCYHEKLSLEEKIIRASKIATESVLKIGTQSSFPTKNELPQELFL